MNPSDLFYALIEFLAIFSALFYTLNIRLSMRKIFYLVLGVVLPTLVAFFGLTNWVGILTLFISTTIVFYIFSKSIRVILDLCVIFIGGIIADHLAQLIRSYVYTGYGIHMIIGAGFFLLFFFTYIYFYKKFVFKQWKNVKLSAYIVFLFFIIVSSTVVVFYLNIFTISNLNAMSLVRVNLAIQLGYFLLISVLFILIFYRLKRQDENKRREIELEQFITYTEALEQVNRDMQNFRHDYANILQTIQGYLDTNNVQDLKDYFRQHISTSGEHTLFRHRVLSRLNNLQLVGIKGLLATKSLQADELGIHVTIDIPKVIDKIQMDIIDLTRVIGILLDNAIEANQSVELGKIFISCYKQDDSVVIQIKNTFQDGTVQLEDLRKETFSTKGTHRGIGLANVRKIMHQYDNALMKTEIQDDWFTQEIEVFEN
ncbi:sensor histidine kinase [Sporosarcina obsidiansis]|uniref:sensor histidine kinase n=1 Tax=Sporosarcina obsidiansis TaxID=2660748 RepID=UPI00129ABABC|nr:sensor histidine kinase [Sporosarcina obsidiansis]